MESINELLELDIIVKYWNYKIENNNNRLICLPSEQIYHYTSASAFNNIMLNRNIWLTKAQYMNDISEIKYACKLFLSRIECSKLEQKEKEKLAKSFNEKVEKGLFENIYVLCFSKNPDSLPLWSYYGKNDGYNIGVDPQFINDLGNAEFLVKKVLKEDEQGNHEFKDVIESLCVEIENKKQPMYSRGVKANSVIYDSEVQSKIFDAILDKVVELIDKNNVNSNIMINLCLELIIDFIPFMKDSHYSNECEYRVLIKIEDSVDRRRLDGIQNFRVFNGAMIPYISIKLNKSNYFRSVCISPFNSHELAISGLEEMVQMYPTELQIRKSSIPSRF